MKVISKKESEGFQHERRNKTVFIARLHFFLSPLFSLRLNILSDCPKDSSLEFQVDGKLQALAETTVVLSLIRSEYSSFQF